MSFDEFVGKLDGAKQAGTSVIARCPAHDDRNPSLSAKVEGSKILVKCFAGCSTESVVGSIGLSTSDLFLDHETGQAVARKIAAVYSYRDENGCELFQTVRYEPKDFRQRHRDGDKWVWKLNGQRRVVYRLQEVTAAETVYIVEGEKDADSLAGLGLAATCNPLGAGKWLNEYNTFFADKTCIIVSDKDEPGRKHAEQVAGELHETAKEVLVIEVPGNAKDASEFLEAGGTIDEIIGLVETAERWRPDTEKVGTGISSYPLTQNTHKLNFVSLDDLLALPEESHEFVWEDTLIVGGFSIISGKPKSGKSTFLRCLCSAIKDGTEFLGKSTRKGMVLYLCLEERRAEVVDHFRRMGVTGGDIRIHTGAAPENTITELAQAVAKYDPVLVVIDPLSRVLRAKDFNDYGQMARAFEPIIDLARKTNVHICALHHDGKMERDGGDALLGSTAIFGAVDSHIQVKRKEKARTVSSTQRYGVDMPETVIALDPDSGWVSAAGTVAEVNMERAKQSILDCFGSDKELDRKGIKDVVQGFNSGQISKAIEALLDEKKLSRTGEGTRGNPYVYFTHLMSNSSSGLEDKKEGGYSGYDRIDIPTIPSSSPSYSLCKKCGLRNAVNAELCTSCLPSNQAASS